MKYQWVLFDADETLFSFNSYFGLKAMLARYQIDFSEQDYQDFKPLISHFGLLIRIMKLRHKIFKHAVLRNYRNKRVLKHSD